MPIAFLMSAIVSGIAMVLLLYVVLTPLRGRPIDMACLNTIATYLFYAVIVDFSLEALDFVHRLCQSEESVKILGHLITQKLAIGLLVLQILLGMVVPLAMLAFAMWRGAGEDLRKMVYFAAAILIPLGIFSTCWNVVIGGQLFSKSFRGLMGYKLEMTGIEGLATAVGLLVLPFVVLAILIRILPTERLETAAAEVAGPRRDGPPAQSRSSRRTLPPLAAMWFRQYLNVLLDLLLQQRIRPRIARRFSLGEARHAHELLGRGGVIGKIVLGRS